MENKNSIFKPHFICTDIQNEYQLKWVKSLIDTDPVYDDKGNIAFVIIGSQRRIEVNTLDLVYLEHCAKLLTAPKGHTACSTDKALISVKEKNGKETLLGVLTHNRIKTFIPIYNKQRKQKI